MVKHLRRQFILTAMLSISLVLLLLAGGVNLLNSFETRQEIRSTLTNIFSSRKDFDPPHKPEQKPDEKYGERPDTAKQRPDRGDDHMERDFGARFFVLRFQEDGTLLTSDLDRVATVTQEDLPRYLEAAMENGEGFGRLGYFHFYVTPLSNGQQQAAFLYCYNEIRSARAFAWYSLLALLCCELVTFLLVFFLSDPVVRPVGESIEKQKRFITDAGHELKTPLTVISTCLSVLEMDVGQQKWIDKAQTQVGKLRNMVNELVSLSRMDEEATALSVREFDLSEAVTQTAEPFSIPAEMADLTLELDIAPNVRCHGDREAICKLVSILLDNAVKYAQGTAPIQVGLRGKTLTVSNACEPLTEEDRSRLFDRFYRADAARAGQVGGSGIGLSIAERIVTLHRGTIRADCPTPDRIVFTVKLK